MSAKSTYSCLLLILLLSFGKIVTGQTLQVQINKKPGANPTTSPVIFNVVFSSPINVASFTAASIVLSGTAQNKLVTSIIQKPHNNGTTFEITVTATNNGTVIATIPAAASFYTSTVMAATGNAPQGIILDGLGNVYTANSDDNTVTKITAAGTPSIFAATGNHPYAITKDVSGNLYTANSYDGTISKITTAAESSIFATTGSHPYAITIDGSGNLYTANSYTSTVDYITAAGVSSKFATTGNFPGSITTDPSGNVYTANYGDNTVTKITPAGVSTLIFANTGSGPFSITADASGNLYTANLYNNTISKITAAGDASLFSKTGTRPHAITIDDLGNVYTANGNNTVSKVTAAGVSGIIGSTGDNPVAIIIDNLGNIYTADNTSNTVTKLTPSGISLFGSDKPVNEASTSTSNTYVLPVSLISFTATNKNCAATLSWKSSFENNSSYYGIEKSNDGKLFVEAVKIASKNSPLGADYSYDFNAVSGTTYYRLKMVDIDGNYTFSKIVTVTANGNCAVNFYPAVSPNPATNMFTVDEVIKGSRLTLFTAAGIQLTAVKAAGVSQHFDISRYAKGVYMLRIEATDGSVQTVKVIKQ